MKDIDNLCMNCFKELINGSVCENCGYDNDKPTDTMYLQGLLEGEAARRNEAERKNKKFLFMIQLSEH